MALIANANRDPKKKASPFTAFDFSPYGEEMRKELEPVIPTRGVHVLKTVFVDSLKGKGGGRR
jgi:hypothetical protein